jgi:Uncharacterized protein conserved in bacteria (DUF2252)
VNIHEATNSYEGWMRQCTTVVESDLRSKHEQMREDTFLFLRGTFYRWAQLWPEICADLTGAPKVLACGDLHVGSFGTWRDSEGRLCWGVDDFDEAYQLPYTNDLVRLATSVTILNDSKDLTISLKDGCDAILEGYQKTLKQGGCPMVLAEHQQNLERLGIEFFDPPPDFWQKLNRLPIVRRNLPRDAKLTLEKTLPDPKMDYRVVRRVAGLGSRGQQRFVAIAQWNGGCIAREAKAMLPSSCVWLSGRVGRNQSYYRQAITAAVRSRDPFQKIEGTWLIRRLSPDSNPIEIKDLPEKRDEQALLGAMGTEAANVHLGSDRAVNRILKDLRRRKANWLRSAAKEMAEATEGDWKKYAKS